MIGENLEPEKLITTKRNLENFSILNHHQLWHVVETLISWGRSQHIVTYLNPLQSSLAQGIGYSFKMVRIFKEYSFVKIF